MNYRLKFQRDRNLVGKCAYNTSLLPVLLGLLSLAVLACSTGAYAGALFTTDAGCNKVNGNIYANKTDVYLNGGPGGKASELDPNTTYCIFVTVPGGDVLNVTQCQVTTDANGNFHCFNLYECTQFADTTNPGGEYTVQACPLPAGGDCVSRPAITCKSDNFKVRANVTGCATVCISCPESFEVPCSQVNGLCVNVTWADPIVSPAGATVVCTNADGTPVESGNNCLPAGTTTTVYCYATFDGQTSDTCHFDVTVDTCPSCDFTCPVVDPVCNDAGLCSGTVNYLPPSCPDAPGITVSCDPPPGTFNVGTTTVTCTFKDGDTEVSSCHFDVVVNDCEPPTITTCPDGGDRGCNPTDPPTCDSVKALVVARDNCTGTITLNCQQDDSDSGCTHTRQFTITATDAAGNTTPDACVVTYTWTVDTEKPTITCPPSGIVVGDPPALATTYAEFVAQGGSASDNCNTDFELVTHDQTTQHGCVEVITRTYAVKDACGKTSDSCTQTITKVPKSLITNTERCCFDCNNSLVGSQFRLLFTPDVSHPGCYKLNASNPGQFYYNVFVTGTPNDTVSLTVTVPFPFITQGAVPIHEYDGLTAYVNSGPLDSTCPAPTCIIPGNDVSSTFHCENGASSAISCGALPGTARTINITGIIPPSGFLMVAIHLDYGLKGCAGYNQNATTPYPDAVTCGATTVQIPGQSSYSFQVTGSQTDTYTLSSFNVFKKNPGVGGGGNHAVIADGVLVLEGVPGVPVVLSTASKIAASNTLATSTTDSDGWYILPYKWTGKAATLYVTMYPGKSNQIQKSITIKANGYVQLDFTLP